MHYQPQLYGIQSPVGMWILCRDTSVYRVDFRQGYWGFCTTLRGMDNLRFIAGLALSTYVGSAPKRSHYLTFDIVQNLAALDLR